MEGPPLGPGGEDITWPDQVAPRGRKSSSSRKIKPQTSNPPIRCLSAGPACYFRTALTAFAVLSLVCDLRVLPLPLSVVPTLFPGGSPILVPLLHSPTLSPSGTPWAHVGGGGLYFGTGLWPCS